MERRLEGVVGHILRASQRVLEHLEVVERWIHGEARREEAAHVEERTSMHQSRYRRLSRRCGCSERAVYCTIVFCTDVVGTARLAEVFRLVRRGGLGNRINLKLCD